jgi:hypothetical protein
LSPMRMDSSGRNASDPLHKQTSRHRRQSYRTFVGGAQFGGWGRMLSKMLCAPLEPTRDSGYSTSICARQQKAVKCPWSLSRANPGDRQQEYRTFVGGAQFGGWGTKLSCSCSGRTAVALPWLSEEKAYARTVWDTRAGKSSPYGYCSRFRTGFRVCARAKGGAGFLSVAQCPEKPGSEDMDRERMGVRERFDGLDLHRP